MIYKRLNLDVSSIKDDINDYFNRNIFKKVPIFNLKKSFEIEKDIVLNIIFYSNSSIDNFIHMKFDIRNFADNNIIQSLDSITIRDFNELNLIHDLYVKISDKNGNVINEIKYLIKINLNGIVNEEFNYTEYLNKNLKTMKLFSSSSYYNVDLTKYWINSFLYEDASEFNLLKIINDYLYIYYTKLNYSYLKISFDKLKNIICERADYLDIEYNDNNKMKLTLHVSITDYLSNGDKEKLLTDLINCILCPTIELGELNLYLGYVKKIFTKFTIKTI